MWRKVCGILLFLAVASVLSCCSTTRVQNFRTHEATPIRIGFYYFWSNEELVGHFGSKENFVSEVDRLLLRATELTGRKFTREFYGRTSCLPKMFTVYMQPAFECDEYFSACDRYLPRMDADFVFILTDRNFSGRLDPGNPNSPLDLFWNGIVAPNQRHVLLYYNLFFGFDAIANYVFVHEVGHLVGLSHFSEEVCAEHPYVMCAWRTKTCCEVEQKLKDATRMWRRRK